VNILVCFSAWKDLERVIVDTDDLEAAKTAKLLEAKEREMEYKLELEKMMARDRFYKTQFRPKTFYPQITDNSTSRYNIINLPDGQ
jgi:hypothetical protein